MPDEGYPKTVFVRFKESIYNKYCGYLL